MAFSNPERISTEELVERHIRAHLDRDDAKCAEYDVAGQDFTHQPKYSILMAKYEKMPDAELRRLFPKPTEEHHGDATSGQPAATPG